MPPAPIPLNEVTRLAALQSCQVLDTGRDSAFDNLTCLAATLLDVPFSLVSLVDSQRQWFKSTVGIQASETSRDHAICAYAILGTEPFMIEDTTNDPRTSDNPLVSGEPGIRSYAGIPLTLPCGSTVGTLCVCDLRPRRLSDRELGILRVLAGQATQLLRLYQQTALAEARAAEAAAARQTAENATRAKSVLLANVSHEIRSPLTAMLGYAEVLAEAESHPLTPRERAVAFDSLRGAGKHLLAVLNDILDLSKLKAGKMTVEQVPTEFPRMLIELESLWRANAAAKGVSLTAQLATPIPERFISDPTRLRQILMNLISNAIKFTSVGSISVTAQVVGDDHSQRLRIDVADTGEGMSDEQAAQLFQAFSQVDASRSRSAAGTGLGLTICRHLATLLGGEIRLLNSTPGEGSTFRLELPMVPAPGAVLYRSLKAGDMELAHASAPATPSAPMPAGAPLSGRILLAEDAVFNQRLVAHRLTKAGAVVEVASTGKVALEMLGRAAEAGTPFDLLISDMQMPEMDGYTLARLLRARGKTIPIIALTAHALPEDRAKCLEAGCSDYVSKPIDNAKLIAACAVWINAGRGARAA